MAKSNSNLSFNESDIDLLSVFKKIVDSKKIIFFSTTIFTLLAFIFSLSEEPVYESRTILEIGTYEDINGDYKLVESSSKSIEDLKFILITKNISGVDIKSINDRLIELKYTSNSSQQGLDTLNELSQYFIVEHKNVFDSLANIYQKEAMMKIDKLKENIAAVNSDFQIENGSISQRLISEKNKTIEEVKFIESMLPFFEKEIKNLEEKQPTSLNFNSYVELVAMKLELFQLGRELVQLSVEIDNLTKSETLLKNNKYFSSELKQIYSKKAILENQLISAEIDLVNIKNLKYTSSSAVNEVETNLVKSNQNLITMIGFIFGLTLSFLIIFFKELIRNTKLASNS